MKKYTLLSSCCDAKVLNYDDNGHGKCSECKENCTSYKEYENISSDDRDEKEIDESKVLKFDEFIKF